MFWDNEATLLALRSDEERSTVASWLAWTVGVSDRPLRVHGVAHERHFVILTIKSS